MRSRRIRKPLAAVDPNPIHDVDGIRHRRVVSAGYMVTIFGPEPKPTGGGLLSGTPATNLTSNHFPLAFERRHRLTTQMNHDPFAPTGHLKGVPIRLPALGIAGRPEVGEYRRGQEIRTIPKARKAGIDRPAVHPRNLRHGIVFVAPAKRRGHFIGGKEDLGGQVLKSYRRDGNKEHRSLYVATTQDPPPPTLRSSAKVGLSSVVERAGGRRQGPK